MDRTRHNEPIDLPMYTAYSLEQLEGFLQEVVPEKELPLEYKKYFKKRIESWKEPDEPTK